MSSILIKRLKNMTDSKSSSQFSYLRFPNNVITVFEYPRKLPVTGKSFKMTKKNGVMFIFINKEKFEDIWNKPQERCYLFLNYLDGLGDLIN